MADSARIDHTGDLIAAIPAMLGFIPQRSLVIAVIRTRTSPETTPIIDAVARYDLEPPGGRQRLAARIAQSLGQICAAEHAESVLAVIIDDRLAGPKPQEPHRPWAARYTALIKALDKSLATHEVLLGGAWAVAAIAGNELWWALLGGTDGGVLPDPGESLLAIASEIDGRRIHRSRAELSAGLDVEPDLSARVAVELDAAIARCQDRFNRAQRHGEIAGYHRALVEYVLWQVAHTSAGEPPGARAIAELVPALREPVVRGALFALAYTEHAEATERLWLSMVRALPGVERADAAALLGYSAYARGDGPYAGMAFDAALLVDPGHKMTGLLESGLRAGMRPGPLRRVARSAHEMAADLGIDLGPLVRAAEVS
ncbi:DUF4192 domain-containing protein [Nocardia sp. NPDC050712]|uniref:DUF4192 domain-containing protein n=1 Tax=Nocardia sp. NPDC050712 TaxID=3155518 RepID=UPI0033CF4444